MNINFDSLLKNKWESQLIHKKHNRIQYASKHYGNASNTIIYKRKHPVKQRKDIKKFKSQRRRKKVHKQMSFDFDDFVFKNKNENFKRIQIKPTMNYQYKYQSNTDIQSMYNTYYNSSFIDIRKSPKKTQNKQCNTNINGIKMNIKLYAILTGSESYINLLMDDFNDMMAGLELKRLLYCPFCTFRQSWKNTKCAMCDNTIATKPSQSINFPAKLQLLSSAKTSLNIYKNNGEIDNKFGTKIEEHSMNNIPIFSEYSSKLKRASKYFRAVRDDLLLQIANKALKSYKTHNNEILNAFQGIKSSQLYKKKSISYNNKSYYDYDYDSCWELSFCHHNKNILLKDVLFQIIPNLWVMYDFLLQYVGYQSFIVLVSADLKLPDLARLKKENQVIIPQIVSNKNSNHGISYYGQSLYKRNRLYSDIVKDIKSYIPSYIFYKEKEITCSENESVFYNIGEYTKDDWKMINFFGEMDWTKMNTYHHNKNKKKKKATSKKKKRSFKRWY